MSKYIVLSLMTFEITLASSDLIPFRSDGCTGFWEGNWCQCCLEHDSTYYIGGTRKERIVADRKFRGCVGKQTGNQKLAYMMWSAVRLAGNPNYMTPFRWGFGWQGEYGYRKLTSKEKNIAHEAVSLTFESEIKRHCDSAE